ncbi:redoxin family protein [Sulfurimonas lithotrophica]|uniref:Redoxin family protein n=1 Tax=Sulfurimonas lithotrophica TaxID=2590022 RepID=A0A5P8NZE4_9BACT|nr:redoxin family protein [Sulfurimonas lithotrophica]QFR48825.1 redoxin family protein [Sulfurimonas lithotrophica]
MESNIKYKDESLELCEDFIDVGYMAENIEVVDASGETMEIKRSHPDKSMTLLASFPHDKDEFLDEILKLDELLSNIQVPLNCYYIFDKDYKMQTVLKNRLKKFTVVLDAEDEFGNMYGTKLVSGSLEDKLTKSLFLISKDGAIFYLDMPNDLTKPFDLERLRVELNKAYASYTGVGCHG